MTQFSIQSSATANAVVEQDRMGGSYLVETGVYLSKIQHAYIQQSAGGALALNIAVDANGKTVREIIYFTSGTAKGVKTFYTDKDGNDQPLPGYSLVNAICKLTTEKTIDELLPTTVPKTLMVYNSEAGKEIQTEVPMIMALVDQQLNIGISKVTEDKVAKNEANGKWEPTGETRDVNKLERFFRISDNKTVSEVTSGTDAIFKDMWEAKNTGVTRVDAKGKASIAGTANVAPAATGGSIFN